MLCTQTLYHLKLMFKIFLPRVHWPKQIILQSPKSTGLGVPPRSLGPGKEEKLQVEQ